MSWVRGLGGSMGRLHDGKKGRGRPLDLILVEISDFLGITQPIGARTIQKLGAPALATVCRLTLSQVNSLLKQAMPSSGRKP